MTLELCRTVAEFRAACDALRARGESLGLVPTMGALHTGHAALMKEAARSAGVVAVTIFVNPTQFGPNEDFERYPRTLEADLEVCRAAGVGLVFAPEAREMYLPDERTRVRVQGISDALCGASRPGHFEGVATIVTKLFAVAGPCAAVFGRKDYQQLKVIERLTRDLLLPVRIVAHATVREPDGLALSSRNTYLSPDERRRALAIPRALSDAVRRHAEGERSARQLRARATSAIVEAGLEIDYVTLADADSCTPYDDATRVEERALLAIAAYAGKTRLIDNLVLGEEPAPLGEARS